MAAVRRLDSGWVRDIVSGMIRVIGFDADDTLWHNENIFEANHARFAALLAKHHDEETVARTLFETEMRNIGLYGYGVKGFALSAIETAIEMTEGRISADELREIVVFAKEMLAHPVHLLDGVSETVDALAADFRLVVITKGDIGHQERKLKASGLAGRFEWSEIVSEKDPATYRRILEAHAIQPGEFLMAGNSLKSDILPVLELGGHGAHVPYHLTWTHEQATEPEGGHARLHTLASIRELPALVRRLNSG